MGLIAAKQKRTSHREQTITLPVSGESIRLVGMTRKEHREWQHESSVGLDGEVNKLREELSTELLVARCAVDELGNREVSDDDVLAGFFDSFDSADWRLLSNTACELVFGKQAKDLEDAGKNSKTLGNGSSGD